MSKYKGKEFWQARRESDTKTLIEKFGAKQEFFGDLEILTWEDNGKPYGKAYRGKSGKHLFYYIFRSEDERRRIIENAKRDEAARIKYREDKAAALKAAQESAENPFKIGDILVNSWGWEQTNIDFYEVTKATSKTVTVREIAQTTNEQTGWMRGTCLPCPGKYTGKPQIKRIGVFVHNNQPQFYVNAKFGSMYKWDGEPENYTAYA